MMIFVEIFAEIVAETAAEITTKTATKTSTKLCNFYKKSSDDPNLGMVYMDLFFLNFCIRNAIGGVYDEVWYCTIL